MTGFQRAIRLVSEGLVPVEPRFRCRTIVDPSDSDVLHLLRAPSLAGLDELAAQINGDLMEANRPHGIRGLGQ